MLFSIAISDHLPYHVMLPAVLSMVYLIHRLQAASLTFARDMLQRPRHGESSGRNSKGLPKSCRLLRLDRALRSSTGVASLLLSREISLNSLQYRSSTASPEGLSGKLVDSHMQKMGWEMAHPILETLKVR